MILTRALAGQIAHQKVVRQFAKFCIVGGFSTLIDLSIFLYIIEVLHLSSRVGSDMMARCLASSISFCIAVTNSYVWNNAWTFRMGSEAGSSKRYAKFAGVNLVGLVLNLLILKAVADLVPTTIAATGLGRLQDPAGIIGKTAATGVVVFWNFWANRRWTFHSPPISSQPA
jgi:putative flippase GtrA